MESSDDLALRLAAIQDALLDLPADAFAEKYELLKERDALREQAAGYAESLDAQRPDDDLLAELASQRSRLEKLRKQKIDLVSQAGSGGGQTGEMGNLGGVALNAQMMKASGADRVQARIAVLEDLLDKRGIDLQ
jgi:hypothetical protein